MFVDGASGLLTNLKKLLYVPHPSARWVLLLKELWVGQGGPTPVQTPAARMDEAAADRRRGRVISRARHEADGTARDPPVAAALGYFVNYTERMPSGRSRPRVTSTTRA